MRVEVLFDKQAKASQPVMAALANELQKKISPHFPNARFRVASSSSTLLQVTGTKYEMEYKSVQLRI